MRTERDLSGELELHGPYILEIDVRQILNIFLVEYFPLSFALILS